jgi:hypothetical protein
MLQTITAATIRPAMACARVPVGQVPFGPSRSRRRGRLWRTAGGRPHLGHDLLRSRADYFAGSPSVEGRFLGSCRNFIDDEG